MLPRLRIFNKLDLRLLGLRMPDGPKKSRTSFQTEPLCLRKLCNQWDSCRWNENKDKIVLPPNVSKGSRGRFSVD